MSEMTCPLMITLGLTVILEFFTCGRLCCNIVMSCSSPPYIPGVFCCHILSLPHSHTLVSVTMVTQQFNIIMPEKTSYLSSSDHASLVTLFVSIDCEGFVSIMSNYLHNLTPFIAHLALEVYVQHNWEKMP